MRLLPFRFFGNGIILYVPMTKKRARNFWQNVWLLYVCAVKGWPRAFVVRRSMKIADMPYNFLIGGSDAGNTRRVGKRKFNCLGYYNRSVSFFSFKIFGIESYISVKCKKVTVAPRKILK